MNSNSGNIWKVLRFVLVVIFLLVGWVQWRIAGHHDEVMPYWRLLAIGLFATDVESAVRSEVEEARLLDDPLGNLDADLNRIVSLVDTGDPDDWQAAVAMVLPQVNMPEKEGVIWVRVRMADENLTAYGQVRGMADMPTELYPAWDNDGYMDFVPLYLLRWLAEATPYASFEVLVLPE